MPRYSDQEITEAVAKSISYAGVLRCLGIRQSGGSNSHIKRRALRIGLDTSHFVGQGWSKGLTNLKRKNASNILLDRRGIGEYRAHAEMLRRGLLEIGREYVCVGCGIFEWRGKKIKEEQMW